MGKRCNKKYDGLGVATTWQCLHRKACPCQCSRDNLGLGGIGVGHSNRIGNTEIIASAWNQLPA